MRRALALLVVLLTLAWALMIAAFSVIAFLVSSVSANDVVASVARVVLGSLVLAAWIYSYLRLRDFFAELILRTPSGTSSRRRRS